TSYAFILDSIASNFICVSRRLSADQVFCRFCDRSPRSPVMEIRRVALIYDDQTRPETTGVYCRRALEKLVHVEHFQPASLASIPRAGFDLYLNIDDGLAYHLPHDLHPTAWWAIDTHMNFAWSHEKARGFDLVFAAQRDGAEQLRRVGIKSATW